MKDEHTPEGDYSAGALAALTEALHQTGKEARRLEALGAEASASDIQALLLAARGAFAQLYREYGGQAEAAPTVTLAELADTYWQAIEQRKMAAPTGVGELDKVIGGGLHAERLYILVGGTNTGKTTLANQMAETIANGGRPVFYVTSEDTPGALLAKTLARLGHNLDYTAALYGSKDHKQAIDEALALVMGRKSSGCLVYLHDTGALSLEQMQAQARAHFKRQAEGGPGLLVIDYLQRMARMQPGQNGRADTRDIVTNYTMRLRAVAEELGCSVLALSSQHRAGYGNVEGIVATAKESGDIEYTADCVLGLFKPDNKRGRLDDDSTTPPAGGLAPGHEWRGIRVAKNRFGPADTTIWLDWYGARQQFTVPGVKR